MTGFDTLAHALQMTRELEPRDVIGWLTEGFWEGYVIDTGIFRG